MPSSKLEERWTILAGEDATRAQQAIWEFIGVPVQTVPFLNDRLRPAKVDEKRIAQLISQLDDESFRIREKSNAELAELGFEAEPALRKTAAGNLSPELHRRVERLLSDISSRPLRAEMLRHIRSIEALEHIATPEARQLLEKLAKGAAGARVTEEAKASIARLSKRKAVNR